MSLCTGSMAFGEVRSGLERLDLEKGSTLRCVLASQSPEGGEQVPCVSCVSSSLGDSRGSTVRATLSDRGFFLVRKPFKAKGAEAVIRLVSRRAERGRGMLTATRDGTTISGVLRELVSGGGLGLAELKRPREMSRRGVARALTCGIRGRRLGSEVGGVRGGVRGVVRGEGSFAEPAPRLHEKCKGCSVLRGTSGKGNKHKVDPRRVGSVTR